MTTWEALGVAIGITSAVFVVGWATVGRWYMALYHEVNDPIFEKMARQDEWERNLSTRGPGCSA